MPAPVRPCHNPPPGASPAAIFLHDTQHLSEQAPNPCPILQEKQAKNLSIHPKPEEKPCHKKASAPHSQRPASPVWQLSFPATPQRRPATTTPCSTSASATTTRASTNRRSPASPKSRKPATTRHKPIWVSCTSTASAPRPTSPPPRNGTNSPPNRAMPGREATSPP